MRVNVQLIDSETGNHLRAERFDKPVADLFDMQDEIVGRLADQLATQLVTADARRGERAPRPNSMDPSRLAHAFDVFTSRIRRRNSSINRSCRCFLLKCAMEFLRVICSAERRLVCASHLARRSRLASGRSRRSPNS
jgi:hypothetical protein